MRDLIFEKRAGWQPRGSSKLKFSQAAAKITRCYRTFFSKVWTIVEKASNSCFEQVGVSLPEISEQN